MINRSDAKQCFAAYVSNYNARDEKIRLKIEHTYKVAALCENIAKSEGLSRDDTDIAWLSGLLHDIGRFEQLRRFGTFIDSQSIDHAAFGANLLFKEGLIREFIDFANYDTLLENVIRTHSLFRLPSSFDERTLLFCNILRDADKIDIFRVNIETPPEEIYNVTTEDLKNSEISPEVMNSFYEEHATLRDFKKTSADNLAGHVSLVYELVFPYSLQETYRQGFLTKLMAFKSDNPNTKKQFEIINQRVNEYISKNLNN